MFIYVDARLFRIHDKIQVQSEFYLKGYKAYEEYDVIVEQVNIMLRFRSLLHTHGSWRNSVNKVMPVIGLYK